MRRRSGYIQIDVSDALDEIADDYLLEEVKARKLIIGTAVELPFDVIERAYEALRGGDHAEALLMLERIVRPKWASLAAAEAEYRSALSIARGQTPRDTSNG